MIIRKFSIIDIGKNEIPLPYDSKIVGVMVLMDMPKLLVSVNPESRIKTVHIINMVRDKEQDKENVGDYIGTVTRYAETEVLHIFNEGELRV